MNTQLWGFQPGTKVSVPLFPPLPFPRHVGMLTERITVHGERIVITTTPKLGVHQTTLREFANGQHVRVDDCASALPWPVVIRRARSLIGRPYHLLGFNCDQVVEYAHGRPVTSSQVGIGILALMGLAIWAANA